MGHYPRARLCTGPVVYAEEFFSDSSVAMLKDAKAVADSVIVSEEFSSTHALCLGIRATNKLYRICNHVKRRLFYGGRLPETQVNVGSLPRLLVCRQQVYLLDVKPSEFRMLLRRDK